MQMTTLLDAPLEIFGIEWDVYLILLVFGIPIFFLTRWLVRKFTSPGRTRTITTWVGTIIMTPLVYGIIGIIIFFAISYHPNNDFNEKQWLVNPDKRYELSKGIIKSKILIGKRKEQVKQMLGQGEPNNSDSTDNWEYYLGIKPEIGNIDGDYLTIDFKNGKVINVSQYQEIGRAHV